MDEDLPQDDLRIVILDALGASLSSKRRDAVSARATSGIESEWQGDEEFYQGYDEANRHEFVNTASKPTESGGSSEAKDQTAGSTVFPNITQSYVDAVSARVGDMLLPTDDRNYALKHTPIPEMLEGAPELPVPTAPQLATPAMPGQPGQPSLTMMPGAEQQAIPEPVLTAVQQAKAAFDKMKAEAARKAENAENHIDDWLQEAQYHAEMRKAIDDAAKLGSGVIKGPVPVKRKSNVWQQGENGKSALVQVEEIKPASFRVDPWNLFPDPACGESIHNGSFIFERDFLTSKKLEDLKGLPGYIDSQIEKCIDEGPGNQKEADGRVLAQNQSTKDQFEIWYYHGTVKTEELIAAGCDCGDEQGRKRSYPALMTMVNNHVIRAALNPLDSGDFPYDLIPWKRRPGMPWGMGLARQLRTPQRIVVGASRAVMNNAGLSSGPQIVVRRGVQPENGIWEVTPLKIWIEEDDSTGSATSPVSSVVIPMLIAELQTIIQLGMKMAEDVTGMPMLMQGQQGKAPDTVGGMTILNNNANAVLRRIARLFDSCITEPHIRRYYAWLMEYGEDDDEKGDFQIIARGSTALVERDIQSQEMVNVIQLCLNPAFGKDPKKAMDEYLKSRRFDPGTFDYSEDELKKIESQPPPEDPRITAAKITADGWLQREQLETKQAADHAAATARMDMQRQAFEASENEKDRALEQMRIDIDAQLAGKELLSDERRDLEKQKVLLASLTLKLQTQRDLSLAGHTVSLAQGRQAMAPPTEPIGRAQPGQAFVQ
jgi:hypothetical protein